jgi:hypothetical protein
MSDLAFNTASGSAVSRELLILYLNTGTSGSPVWSPIGKRVEDSSAEYDWGDDSKVDIFGTTYTTFKKPTITQSFDPCELDSGDVAQVKIWNATIRNHDIAAMANQDLLLVHLYAGTAETAVFAERYPCSAVKPSKLGGSSSVEMPIDVTFGGTRSVGTAAIAAGVVTYTAA